MSVWSCSKQQVLLCQTVSNACKSEANMDRQKMKLHCFVCIRRYQQRPWDLRVHSILYRKWPVKLHVKLPLSREHGSTLKSQMTISTSPLWSKHPDRLLTKKQAIRMSTVPYTKKSTPASTYRVYISCYLPQWSWRAFAERTIKPCYNV